MSIVKKLEQATKRTSQAEQEFVKAIEGQYKAALIAIKKRIAQATNYQDFTSEMQKYNRIDKLIEEVEQEITPIQKESKSNMIALAASIYAINYYMTGYALETETQKKLSYKPLDEKKIKQLVYFPLDKLAIENNEFKVKQAIRSTLTQALLQGWSIPQTAEKIKANLEDNANNAVRIARTEILRANSIARYDSMQHSANMGLITKKTWDATIDKRTRDSHIDLDGKTIPFNETFPNGLLYPRDPAGAPEEVINCRCELIPDIGGLDITKEKIRIRGQEELIPYTTYNDWYKNRVIDSN